LREHVIDLVAPAIDDLLAAADGRTVLANGHTTQLATRDASIREIGPNWREQFLGVLTNPSLLYLLLLAGLAGVTFELTHPGIYAPGVLGTICLLLAGYGLNLLPVDYAGLALAIFGFGLIVAEAFIPAFGAFVLGGAAAFLIGSLLMFRDAGLRPPLGAIYAATIAAVLVFGVALGALLRARRHPVVSGDATLLGATGRVTAWNDRTGHVIVHGEHWNARGSGPLAAGESARVIGRDGLMLLVEAATNQPRKQE
jgi:membrane-bound serine protease (ClpP class)